MQIASNDKVRFNLGVGENAKIQNFLKNNRTKYINLLKIYNSIVKTSNYRLDGEEMKCIKK